MTENTFHPPPETRTSQGTPRRVGFELEFAGVDLEDAAEVVRELFGGKREILGPHRFRVEGTRLGDFGVEMDAEMLQDRRYLEVLAALGLPVEIEDLEEPIEKMVGWLAGLVVPYEVVTPPLDLGEMARVEELRMALAAREARGTGARLRYALGLHINPDAPALDVGTLLRHLQAFLALYDRLVERSKVDLTRSLAPFIEEFPAAYRELVLHPDYDPSLEELASDYLAHNPTRNRPLDLLPLLAHAIGEEVLADLPDREKVRPRPTFHYRLPNCRLDEPEWTVAEEWNRWVDVERLAARPGELERARFRVAESPGLLGRFTERAREALRREEEDD